MGIKGVQLTMSVENSKSTVQGAEYSSTIVNRMFVLTASCTWSAYVMPGGVLITARKGNPPRVVHSPTSPFAVARTCTPTLVGGVVPRSKVAFQTKLPIRPEGEDGQDAGAEPDAVAGSQGPASAANCTSTVQALEAS